MKHDRLRVMYPSALMPGGAERQMMLLAEHLPRERFDVTFIALRGATDMGRDAQRLGATVHVLDAPSRAGRSMPLYAATVAGRVASYVAICRRERFDIVDAWLYLGYGLAAITRPLARVPVLIAGRRSLGGFKRDFGRVERTIDGIARRGVDIIVANSSAVADDVVRRERIDRAKVRIIRNGVIVPPPPGAAGRRAARAAMGVTDEGPVVGCVGTFKPGKGQHRVVEVMTRVRKQETSAWLVFVGDGPERAVVERLVRDRGLDRVRFLGTVADARRLYPGFDVLVSASDAEGLPNVVLEGAAAGLPIVATAAGGTGEIVLDGQTGLLVPVGDPGRLADAVLRVLGDHALGDRLGRAARDHVVAAFGVDRFVAETAALYEEMAKHHGE